MPIRSPSPRLHLVCKHRVHFRTIAYWSVTQAVKQLLREGPPPEGKAPNSAVSASVSPAGPPLASAPPSPRPSARLLQPGGGGYQQYPQRQQGPAPRPPYQGGGPSA